METLAIELAGRRIAGPEAVGDALRGLVKAAKDELRPGAFTRGMQERVVGRFGGFELGIRIERGEQVPRLYLAGHLHYDAEAYQTGPALASALLQALASVGKHHADAVEQLALRRKRLEDIQLELVRSFEHEDRLTALLVRQRDLMKRLDLDKDEVGSAGLDTDEARQAA
jgi:hypothetical protein